METENTSLSITEVDMFNPKKSEFQEVYGWPYHEYTIKLARTQPEWTETVLRLVGNKINNDNPTDYYISKLEALLVQMRIKKD